MRRLPFITDNGAAMPIVAIGMTLDFDEIPRYGVWTWDGRRYQCSATSNDLEALQREHNVPVERVIKTNAALKLGVKVLS